MKRKFLSLVLALVMVLGTFSAVLAETTPLTTNDAKIQWLIDNKVVEGRKVNENDANDLALDSKITRAEVSKLLVYTLGEEKLADVLKGAIKVFPDVDLDHWANGYVSVLATSRNEVASGRRVIIGYEDGNFRPNNDVTYAELATMLVRIVKKDLTAEMEKNAIWATSYIRWAEELGILDGIKLVDSDAPAVRRDAFVMIYNAMHKLNLVGKNKVDWGIKIGIVSKLQAGKMEINQDKEQTYNLTYDTVVTNGTNWAEVSVNTVVPGSLVRFIADENGNVSHLLVVSYPTYGQDFVANQPTSYGQYSGFHFVDGNRIYDLGRYVAGGINGYINFTSDYRPYANLVVEQGNTSTAINLTGNERVFVADPVNNALKEVKSITDAVKTYAPNVNKVKGYVIYNTYERFNKDKVNEATVVVFTEVDKYHGSSETLRVKYTPNSLYDVQLENTKGEVVVKNLHQYAFLPVSYKLSTMDVVGLTLPSGATQYVLPGIKISYANDPVFEVVDLTARTITLKDKDNRIATLDMPVGTKVFLEGQLAKGVTVQIDQAAELSNVKTISVVNLPLRGNLKFKNLVDTGIQKGFVIEKSASKVQHGFDIITVADKLDNGDFVNRRTVLVANDLTSQPDDKPILIGREYQFRVTEGWNYQEGMRVAVEFVDLLRAANKVNSKVYAIPATAIANEAEFNTRYAAAEEIIARYNNMPEYAKAYLKANETDATYSQVAARAKVNAEIDALNAYIDANNLTKAKLAHIQ